VNRNSTFPNNTVQFVNTQTLLFLFSCTILPLPIKLRSIQILKTYNLKKVKNGLGLSVFYSGISIDVNFLLIKVLGLLFICNHILKLHLRHNIMIYD